MSLFLLRKQSLALIQSDEKRVGFDKSFKHRIAASSCVAIFPYISIHSADIVE
jgi:hypothetical protein